MKTILDGNRIAVAFGGYVPLHEGHLDLINRAKRENDGCIIIVGGNNNPDERGGRIGLPVSERYKRVTAYFASDPLVVVVECDEPKFGIQQYPNGWNTWMQWSQPMIRRIARNATVFTWYSGESKHEAELKKRFDSTIQNRVVIVERINPISGTKIREKPVKYLNQVTSTFTDAFTQ